MQENEKFHAFVIELRRNIQLEIEVHFERQLYQFYFTAIQQNFVLGNF